MRREILSWIKGSSFLSEDVENKGLSAARRMRCFSWEMVPKIESMFVNAWDQVGGLSRLVWAPAKRTS